MSCFQITSPKLVLVAGLLTLLLGGCLESSTKVDEGLGLSPGPNFGIGNSAIGFLPVKHDFGIQRVGETSPVFRIKIINLASDPIYIQGIGNSSNPHFEVIEHECPLSPSPLPSGAGCSASVSFAPKTSGVLEYSLPITFGSASNTSEFFSTAPISGRGISSLNFDGIDSFDLVTHNSARLHWTPNSQAVAFYIYRSVNSTQQFLQTVINTGGVVGSSTLTGLLPSTTYRINVRAVDELGQQDNNLVERSFSTLTNIGPALTAISDQDVFQGLQVTIDANDNFTGVDIDQQGDELTYSCFFDQTIDGSVSNVNACGSLLNENASSASFSTTTGEFQWTPRYAEIIDSRYEIKITGRDVYGGSDQQVFVFTIKSGIPNLSFLPKENFSFPDDFLEIGDILNLDAFNTFSGSDEGVDSYTCQFDRTIDGTLTSGQNCTLLPGGATFDSTLGQLNWDTNAAEAGTFELHFSATSIAGTGTQRVILHLRADWTTTSLLAAWDALFATSLGQAPNNPFFAFFKNLVSSDTNDFSLSNFTGGTLDGWFGDGSSDGDTPTTGPFRLRFDGTNNYGAQSEGFGSISNFMFDGWILAENPYEPGTLFSNASASSGLSLRQSSSAKGILLFHFGEKSLQEEILSDNPVAYLSFDEPLGNFSVDLSSRSNDANLTGISQSGLTPILANDNRSALFNGAGYATCGTSGIPTTPPITLEAWAFFASNQAASDFDYVLQTSTFGTSSLFNISRHEVNNQLYYVFNGGVRLGPELIANSWHHIVLSFRNTTPYVKLYLNGVDRTADLQQPSSPLTTSSADCVIGAFRNGGSITHHMNAGNLIDEVAIYDYELSEARVVTHYQAASRLTCRSNRGLRLDPWEHVGGFFDSTTNRLRLYLNSNEVCSISSTGPAGNIGTNNFSLGANSLLTDEFWKGSLAQMRFYSDGGAAEIAQNYNATKTAFSTDFPTTGLRLWTRADSLFGVENGQNVRFWRDESGSNNHLYANDSNTPTFVLNALGPVSSQLPALSFNGVNQRLLFSTAISDVQTVFFVKRWAGLTGAYRAVLGHSTLFELISAGTGQFLADSGFSSPNFINGSVYINGGPATPPVSTQKPTDWSLVSLVMTGPTNADHLASDRFIGGRYFWGDIAELLIYNRTLSTLEREKVESYLSKKYDLNLN